MIVDLKEGKLKPNTLLFYDGKKIIYMTPDELIKPFIDEIKQLRLDNTIRDQKVDKHLENANKKIEEHFGKFNEVFKTNVKDWLSR